MPQVAALGLPPQAIWAAVFAFGCVLGSFLNVVIHRLPRMEGYWSLEFPRVSLPVINRHTLCVGDHSVVLPLPIRSTYNLALPPSACPACGKPIAWYDNIPVLSWILLGGRCRQCRHPISVRYPVVELAMGILVWGLYLHFGPSIRTLGLVVLVGALMVCFWIDVDFMIIPDSVTLPILWAGLIFNAVFFRAAPAVVGAAGGYLLFRAIEGMSLLVLKREGMGRGDAKLAAMLGAWVGPAILAAGLFVGFVVGSLVGVGVEFARHRWNLRAALGAIARRETRPFPLGPSLVIGGLASIFGGDRMFAWYLGFLRG